jgi:hypothetical protein
VSDVKTSMTKNDARAKKKSENRRKGKKMEKKRNLMTILQMLRNHLPS